MCGSSFNNVSERSTENTIKLINGLVDNLENCSSLSDFKYVFRSSRLTADLLTVAELLGLAKYLWLTTFRMTYL